MAPHFYFLGLLCLHLALVLYSHSELLAPLLSLRGQPKEWKESFSASQDNEKKLTFPLSGQVYSKNVIIALTNSYYMWCVIYAFKKYKLNILFFFYDLME